MAVSGGCNLCHMLKCRMRWNCLAPILSQLQSGYTFLPRGNDTLRLPAEGQEHPRILILRCSSHADVQESMTHIVLFDHIKRHRPDALIDFAFFPSKLDRQLLERAELPWPLGIRSLRSLNEFDMVLINLSYVLELLNILPMLVCNQLGPWSSQRSDHAPLLILGGSGALGAQALVRQENGQWDSMVDGFFFGEFEESAPAILQAVFPDQSLRPVSRTVSLLALTKIEGLWVPGQTPQHQSPVVKKAVCRTVDLHGFPQHYPVLNGSEADTCRLQISYGCPFSCSFCFEGFERKPYRDLSAAVLLDSARKIQTQTGARSLDLVSFNFNTHRQLTELMPAFNQVFRHVHFMSQRLDILNRTRYLLENELAADKRSYTLGVEGISRRFRSYYDKKLADTDINQLCTRLLQNKVKEIKFFYIISGLETATDLREFNEFLQSLVERKRLFHPGCRLIFSFGVLCRMPFTPLQFSAIPDDPTILHLLDSCQILLKNAGAEFRTAFSTTEFQLAQVLCLGESQTHHLLIGLHQAEITFSGKLAPTASAILKHFLKTHDYENRGFFGEKAPEWHSGFGFVDIGLKPGELHERYMNCRATLSCPPRTVPVDELAQRPGIDQKALLTKLLADKNRAKVLFLEIMVPPACAGASDSWLEAWIMRGLTELTGISDAILETELGSDYRASSHLPAYWYGQINCQVKFRPNSDLPERIKMVLGKRAGNGFSPCNIVPAETKRKDFVMIVELPLSLGPLTQAWNRSIQEMGIGATLTKNEPKASFVISPKCKGKKLLFRVDLHENVSGMTECKICCGNKFEPKIWLPRLFGGQNVPFFVVALPKPE